MQKGRWVAVGCVSLFALPFILAGLLVAFGGGHGTNEDAWVRVLVGSVFTVVGVALIGATVYGTGVASAAAVLRTRNPQQPWLWRDDWSRNVVQERGAGAELAFLWIFALVWNLVDIPVLRTLNAGALQQHVMLFILLFPLVGVALLAWVVSRTWRLLRFGTSLLHLDRVPIVPGREFHVELDAHVRDTPAGGFVVRLSCIRRERRSKSNTESLLWREEQTVTFASPSPQGVRVPFTFRVPDDATPAGDETQWSAILWRLDVSAEVPGVDYAASFELPVFATGETLSHDDAHPHWPAPQADPLRWTPAIESRIAITPLPGGGEEFRIGTPPAAGGCGLVLFAVIWFGVIALMLKLGAPVFMAVIFTLFGLLVVIAALDFYLGRATVRADRTGVAVRRTWLGAGSWSTIPVDAVEGVVTKVGMTQGGGSGTPYYDVLVQRGSNKETYAARYLRSKRDAEMLAARIRHDLGKV